MNSELRIHLQDVSIRFRLSYHRIVSIPQFMREWQRRLTSDWRPEYHMALHNVSLRVRTGEIVGVIGRNGSGKTTMLRTISGIYAPDTGSVQVSGRVSALLQLGTGFNTALSGRSNIVLGGLTLGYSRQRIMELLPAIAEFAELGKHIDVPMRYYSSGMISRLSFAMVASLEPDILLIDETLSVGDIAFQKKSKAAMQSLLQKASCQMIVSHSMDVIERLCTRAILVDHGRILADDVPAKVIKEYRRVMRVMDDTPSSPALEIHNMVQDNSLQ